MKKIIAFLIAFILLLTPVFAYETALQQAAAQNLFDLGLFKGVGQADGSVDFALGEILTREQAVTLLIRLLGKEQEAYACDFPCSFPDVPEWAVPYVGYAQVTGLTLGMGDGTFGGGQPVTGVQFLTFLLRALGYSTPIDFVWSDACTMAESIGLPGGDFAGIRELSRGDAIVMCNRALGLETKSGKLLSDAIKASGTVKDPAKVYDVSSYSAKGMNSDGSVRISDEDGAGTNAKKLINQASSIDVKADGKVRVLIVHTHATEGYTPNDGLEYKEQGGVYRTLNDQRNMLKVGEVVTNILNSRGIGTVHLTVIEDYPNYNNAYKRMAVHIQKVLDQYPDIEVVIDMHRDSFSYKSKNAKTSATVNGMECAQLMFTAGTGSNPDWKETVGTQVRLHHMMENRYPGLMRPMIVRDSNYNHGMTPGSMLIEVGTSGNSLSEAMYSAYLFGTTLADYLLGARE
jgi:stage II sporulation protein P